MPDEVLGMYRGGQPGWGRASGTGGTSASEAWTGDRDEWNLTWANEGRPGWPSKLPSWKAGESVATRSSINAALNAIAGEVPGIVSGGADLTGNTGTRLDGANRQGKDHPEGRALAFGVREHAMGGVMTGLSLHGGVIPIGGTFFVFSDYMRGAVRLAAVSGAKVIYFWTHDSVGLGRGRPESPPAGGAAGRRPGHSGASGHPAR